MPPLPQAPERQTTLTRVTPIVGDILVSATKEYQRKEIPDYGTPMGEIITQGLSDKYKDHVFTYAEPQQNQREDIYTCYFAAPRENQDSYNWEAVKANIGGQEFDAVRRTYVILRSEYDLNDPAMGTAMPDVPVGKFTTPSGYILAVKQQERLGKELDSWFVVESRTYLKKVTITSIGSDPLNGRPLASIRTIYHKDEVVTDSTTAAQLFADLSDPYWGTQSDGYARTGRQISAEFYEIVSEQVVAVSGGGVVNDYFTVEDFYWPAVLAGVRIYDYELRNGGTEVYTEPYFSHEAYRGPCKARVEILWSSMEHNIDPPEIMQPLPLVVNTPFYSYSIGPTLHVGGTLTAVTGSHPKYALNAGVAAQWDATSPTDWPATVRAADEQRPYRGGWLRTRVTIYQPSFS